MVVELAMACSSAGDAFRSLDQKDLVKNTFVLVSGDVVVNMDLASAYREHLARRLASPAAIMTLARPLSGCPPGMHTCPASTLPLTCPLPPRQAFQPLFAPLPSTA